MLDDVRVLEVSAPETMLAGRILADLGADVIVVRAVHRDDDSIRSSTIFPGSNGA
jgi:crotonobetainyl-CoA:carnitine CoA-transferase CaiB-like acyl-CoA transferase